MGLLDDTRNFMQGASNSVAGMVTAPVDGISWAMRKAGLGNVIGDAPVGGSDWMQAQGLLRAAPGKAGLLGEALGGVLPMVAAAKAPQIAAGMLRAGENLAAPAAMNPQMGAVVYHGSPHSFNSFDMSKIGTGEGAQAYGHGLYFADSPATAKSYQEALSSTGAAQRGLAQAGNIDSALADAQKSVAGYQNLIANGGGGDPRRAQGMLSIAQKQLEDLQRMKAGLPENTGSLYKVDLPDEHIAKMLDWDKPLSQQSPGVQQTLLAADPRAIDSLYQNGGEYYRALMSRHAQLAAPHISLDAAENMAQAPASQQLRALGIPGIKYLDQGSRGAGAGTSNYVVFDDALPKILERNGTSLGF